MPWSRAGAIVGPMDPNTFDWLGFNPPIIDEFRANAGECGGRWEGNPMILLTTTGISRSVMVRYSPKRGISAMRSSKIRVRSGSPVTMAVAWNLSVPSSTVTSGLATRL